MWEKLIQEDRHLRLVQELYELFHVEFLNSEETQARLKDLHEVLAMIEGGHFQPCRFPEYTRRAAIRQDGRDFHGSNNMYAVMYNWLNTALRLQGSTLPSRIERIWTNTGVESQETDSSLSNKGDIIEFLINEHCLLKEPAVQKHVRQRRLEAAKILREFHEKFVAAQKAVWFGMQAPRVRDQQPVNQGFEMGV